MTAKEYLQQAFRIDQRINGKLEMVARLRESATKVTTNISDMPRASSPNLQTMESTVAKLVDLEADINRDVDALVDLKREIIDTIGTLDKPEHQMVLESRYLCYKSWEQIALEMNVQLRWVYRLHGRALSALEQKLNSN
ncbi:MAG: hypothetical protein RSD95_10015 [Clostridia bacterium]